MDTHDYSLAVVHHVQHDPGTVCRVTDPTLLKVCEDKILKKLCRIEVHRQAIYSVTYSADQGCCETCLKWLRIFSLLPKRKPVTMTVLDRVSDHNQCSSVAAQHVLKVRLLVHCQHTKMIPQSSVGMASLRPWHPGREPGILKEKPQFKFSEIWACVYAFYAFYAWWIYFPQLKVHHGQCLTSMTKHDSGGSRMRQ